MSTRSGIVMLTVVVLLIVEHRVAARSVPHHRRRGEGGARLQNVTLNNATLFPVTSASGELVLEGYRIDHFGQELFDLLRRTASLTLKQGRIPKVTFRSHTLDTLEIRATGLQHFEVEPAPSPELHVLQITRNALERITPRISYLVGLRHLDLSQNRLTSVDLGAFEPLRHLRDLDLSVNRIVQLYGGSTERPLTVRNLWVSYNRLQAFDGFPGMLPSLETVRLNGNAWRCPWVDWARGEIVRQGITVFGADYDCAGERRGGLCCYDGEPDREKPSVTPDEVSSATMGTQSAENRSLQVASESNGTIGVRFEDVEIFFDRTNVK